MLSFCVTAGRENTRVRLAGISKVEALQAEGSSSSGRLCRLPNPMVVDWFTRGLPVHDIKYQRK